MEHSLSQFTQQYQVAKTLRFELKPVAETADWINKHNIIGTEGKKLVGKDAERAKSYKSLKRLLDEMHRTFIEQALKIETGSVEQQELEKIITTIANQGLEADYPSIISYKAVKVRAGLKALFEHLYNTTVTDWIYQYKEDMPTFWQQDIDQLTQKCNETTDKKQIKFYQNIINKLANKRNKVEFKGKDYKALYNGALSLQLLEWLVRKETFKLTPQDLLIDNIPQDGINKNGYLTVDSLINIIRQFDGFTTYLTGFNENRANIYDLGDNKSFKSTSILARSFEQNLMFHLANSQKWQTIFKNITTHRQQLADQGFDIQAQLSNLEQTYNISLDEFFAPETFIKHLNQAGIDKYNQVLGGIAEKPGIEKTQGLNELINLTRQKLSAKRNQFPPLQLLYKQILSKGDKPFIEAFTTDQEMVAELNSFVQELIDNPEGFISCFAKELHDVVTAAKQDKAHIYLSKDKLSVVAHALSRRWQSINTWIEAVLPEKEAKQTLAKQGIAIAELEQILQTKVEDEDYLEAYVNKPENELADKIMPDNIVLSWFEYQIQQLLTAIAKYAEKYKQLQLTSLDANRDKPGDKGFEQIATIKNLLDACNELNHFLSHFKWRKQLPKQSADYWYSFIQTQLDAFPIFELYNKVRNYVTKKPFSTEKVKINFNNSTLLDGWDRNKESANYGILLEKQGMFYLAVMTPNSNNIFDYEPLADDSESKTKQKLALKQQVLTSDSSSAYKKINYKLLPGPNKMLPKVFFAKSNIEYYQPSAEIIKIKEKKLYSKAAIQEHGIDNLHKYIEFCQQSLIKHPEWANAFGFNEKIFKPANTYHSVDEFYREVEQLGYSLNFDNISSSYIDEKVATGELYLFRIYNKDFSTAKKRKGTDNLHTSYWKLLFAEENLKDVVIKLNGQAEVFYRPASITYSEEKRQKGHHADQLKGKFNYPILKDKRYSEDKFLFHCPITFNFKSPSQPISFNQKVREFLKDNQQINIIGIDRGEKHLLYFSVIDLQGNILEQGSFNNIVNSYEASSGKQEKIINYHQKLDEKEQARDEARKSWATIENIKELKAGYLSHVVHQLAKLIIKHNAIVVLEDLNQGFKRGRTKIEKQVYQKFEKALIDKLNYLAFKDREKREQAGHYLNAYQLTNKFESFQKLGKQSGILFYTTADYTSTTDPITGFIKNIYVQYKSVQASIEFWQKFESILYNKQQDRFEFTYDLKKFGNTAEQLNKTVWTVCSHVQRSFYVPETKSHELFVVTDRIKALLANVDYNFMVDPEIKGLLSRSQSKQLHKEMIKQFNFILSMRVTDSRFASGTSENDFILSPVEPFFDSRKNYKALPENGDANGAYNIARKGLLMLHNINQSESMDKVDLLITKTRWQNYCQQEQVQQQQRAKIK